MTAFFLIPGTPEYARHQAELAEREARHDEAMEGRVRAVEAALIDDTREGLRLVELARLLDSTSFRMREEAIERAISARSRVGANEPARQRANAIHERTGRLSVENALRKAREIMLLINSWGADDPSPASMPQTGGEA